MKKLIHFFKFLFISTTILSLWIGGNGSPLLFAKTDEIRQGESGLVYPLLDCADEEDYSLIRPFQHKLENLVNTKLGDQCSHISVYYRDLNNGPWFGIAQDELFSAASLLKVPTMMAFFNSAKNNPDLLLTKIKFNLKIDENESLNIPSPIKLLQGESYTIDELIRDMIVYSDNNASTALQDYLPQEFFDKTFTDLGMKIPQVREAQDMISIKEYASFFRILYNATYLGKLMSVKALKLLTEVKFKDGLVAGVPSNITVAHKYGERGIFDKAGKKIETLQFHECGIIYYPKRPYILAVMTRGKDLKYLISVVRDISKLVYEEIDAQMKQ